MPIKAKTNFQEQSTISKLLADMTPEQKEQYSELEATAAALREEVETARTQLDFLNKEKHEFSTEISGSQVWGPFGYRIIPTCSVD